MNESEITDVLLGDAVAVAAALLLPVSLPNRSFNPPDTGKYLEVIQFRNTAGSPSWGGMAVYMGILQISYHQRNDDTGAMPGADIQAAIESYYRKNRLIYGPTGKITIYQNASELTPITETDKTIYPVSIPYIASRGEGS